MKNYTYLGLFLISLGFIACDVNNDLDEIKAAEVTQVEVNANGVDFSNYVAIGASFTAGYTDGALFTKAQENSFPNILASKFALAGGGAFNQPLMNDNIGGLLFSGTQIQEPRLYFKGGAPTRVTASPTTDVTTPVIGEFNNYGIPGAKSFHIVAPGYGNLAGVPTGAANPYFARMSSNTTTTVLADALAKAPTFFTLSEMGGNDVLGYAVSGGAGVDQKNNFDPSTYGSNDITSPAVFNQVFNSMVDELTAGGRKGVVANLPDITDLPYFTTVPYNPLNPIGTSEAAVALAGQIPLLNTVYGVINQIYTAAGEPERSIVFTTIETNALVIFDEDATDLSATIATALGNPNNTAFIGFVQSLGLPAQAAPLVAQLLGQQYGKARSATSSDLIVLQSRPIIGKVNPTSAATLEGQGLSATLAGQFSAEGITLPLEDKWVLTPQEQAAIKTATDAYNTTIQSVATAKGLAFVDFKNILSEAKTGLRFDNFNLTTSLVRGGLVSLDGIHLTARGYALMANRMLAAIDLTYGSNFTTATNGLAKAVNYSTNYPQTLQ